MQQPSSATLVRQFRQILLWPLQLMPIRSEGTQIQRHWELLEEPGPGNPWHEVVDEFTGEPGEFQERHYNEFMTFLPHVQRFLYGEGRSRRSDDAGGPDPGASPMRVFRRDDVAAVRLTSCAGSAPRTLSIAHVDLYFFYDIDVVLLNVEIAGDDLTLYEAEDTLYRFGRAYPAAWEDDGEGAALHAPRRVARRRRQSARGFGCGAAREVPVLRQPAPGAAHLLALGVAAEAAGAASTPTTKGRSVTDCSSTTACR